MRMTVVCYPCFRTRPLLLLWRLWWDTSTKRRLALEFCGKRETVYEAKQQLELNIY